MKRGQLLLFITVLVLIMFGCDNKEEVVQEYEYHFRELADAVYVDAADGFSGGNGTVANPYEISNAEELAYLAEVINSDELNEEYTKCHYVLTKDIIINDSGDFANWKEKAPRYSWKPIGYRRAYGFKGTFDGCGYTIEGIYINENAKEHDWLYGLFGEVYGTIKDVCIKNAYITVSGYTNSIGTLAGITWQDAVIENCDVYADIECYDSECGGLIGSNAGSIIACQFEGTIACMKDYVAGTQLAGIAGSNYGTVQNCGNWAELETMAGGVVYMGGIVGFLNGGIVESCKNEGSLKDKKNPEEEQDSCMGGIVGVVYAGQEENIHVAHCHNTAILSGGADVAGIVGNITNDGNAKNIFIENCRNDGAIKNGAQVSGVASSIHCNGATTCISNCVNRGTLEGEKVAGIASSVLGTSGTLEVMDCNNEGSIKCYGTEAAGVLGTVTFMADIDLELDINNCVNSGRIETEKNAAGIVCLLDYVTGEISDASQINITDCLNKGDIHTNNSSAYIAGIIGCLSAQDIEVNLSDCLNGGDFEFKDTGVDEELLYEVQQIALARICGGIIGRIGGSLYMATESESATDMSFDVSAARIRLTSCYSCGSCAAPDEKKYTNKMGQALYSNSFAGIIGDYSGEEGYAFSVENCGYANMDKGCDSFSAGDVGESVPEHEILEMLKEK